MFNFNLKDEIQNNFKASENVGQTRTDEPEIKWNGFDLRLKNSWRCNTYFTATV